MTETDTTDVDIETVIDTAVDDTAVDGTAADSETVIDTAAIDVTEPVGGADDEPEIAPELDQRRGPLAHYDERHCVLWISEMPIPFRRGVNANAELVELLGAAIRGLRGLGPTDACPLRRSEHQLLADLLDLDAPDLRTDLRRHLGLSKRQAGDTLMQLRRVRAKDEMMMS